MASYSSYAYLALLLGLFGSQLTAGAAFNYGEALEKSLLFFEAQRSGKLPSSQRVKWRGDSGLKDGLLQGVDLVGGYYDSGDHVKFGLPMAYTVTMLSWGCIEFQKEMAAANQLQHVLDAIKWGTDYFIKAHTKPHVFWGQVGDGDSDHYCWERPEDMTTPRTGYKISPNLPGSDLAGETAAAMAVASLAFKAYDSTYSQLLLLHAKQLFSFADTFRGRYDDSITVAKEFYPSSTGYADELLWAAAWLFRATKDEHYLKYVVDNAVALGGTGWAVREFSWDNKYAGLQVLLSKMLMDGDCGSYAPTIKQYQAKAEFFLCSCLQKNDGYNVDRTPGGLMYVDEWNNMQYVSSASFLLAVYSTYLSASGSQLVCPEGRVQPTELLRFAQSQADYILGNNPKSISYVVGYGPNYPHQVHHRGASIAAKSLLPSAIGCLEGFEKWYHLNESNPNVIVGALVGGPDKEDGFSDERGNYQQTEPSLAGNAPLLGLFAKLTSLSGASGNVTRNYPAPEMKGDSIKLLHSITGSWTSNGKTYYRHKVTLYNMSKKPIYKLKIGIENLSGPLWGLSPTSYQKNAYELPPWIKVLKPGSKYSFVYVQGGPQAQVAILDYN